MTINEMRTKRAKAWDAAKAFLDSHTNENGMLSPEDDAVYTKMENEIADYSKEIARLERREALDAELNMPTSKRITEKPDTPKPEDEKTGKASDHVITTSSGAHKIPVVASHGSAAWIDEEGAYTEGDETFGQAQLDAHKVGTIIKVSEELLNDSAFDLEGYFVTEFARRIGEKEEEAFLVGNGTLKPTGILNTTGGGEVGVTSASATAITADELIDLYHSLKEPYRKDAVWILNDSTVKAIRKLKDGNGQYLWQPGIKDGEENTILGRPYFTSSFVPEIKASAKTVIFGNINYYWIGDREGITFKRLNELFAGNGQVGFLAYKRLDGKTVLPEAIKILQMKSA